MSDGHDWTIRHASDDDGLGSAPSARGFVLGCWPGAEPVGVARALEADGRFHLVELAVDPQWSGRGVGTGLLRAVEDEVVARGATVLTLLAPAADAQRANLPDVRQPSPDLPAVPQDAPTLPTDASPAGQANPGKVGAVWEPASPGFFERHGYERSGRLPVALRWLAGRDDGVALARTLAPEVAPRAAVSVIPLRDGGAGLEAFAQHRVGTMDFAAGAVVFPGGRVDPVDHEMRLPVPHWHAEAWARTVLPDAATLVAAGIREVAEECGVLLEPSEMVPWDNWVTPAGGRRRFDVAFFVTHVTTGFDAWGNTSTESVHSRWEPVAGLLEDERAGRIRLMAPTKALLEELAGFATAGEVLAHSPAIAAVLDDEPLRPRPAGS